MYISIFHADNISECTYVQSKSEQDKLSCAVEAVTSRDSISNVLGCSQTAADSKQKHSLCYSAGNAKSTLGHNST